MARKPRPLANRVCLKEFDLSQSTRPQNYQKLSLFRRYKEERRNYLRQKYKVDALKSEDDQKDEEMISRLKQKVKHPQSTTPTSTGSSVSLEDTLKSPTKTTVSILYTPTVSNTFIQVIVWNSCCFFFFRFGLFIGDCNEGGLIVPYP